MKFDISLTTTRSTSQEEADNFIGAMTSRGFSVIQGRINDRYFDDNLTTKCASKSVVKTENTTLYEQIQI